MSGSGRIYLEPGVNGKHDGLVQSGEKVDGKTAAHVLLADSTETEKQLHAVLHDILSELKQIRRHQEIITGVEFDEHFDS